MKGDLNVSESSEEEKPVRSSRSSVLVGRKLRMLRRLMALFINAMSENGLVEEVFEHTFYEEKG